MQTRKLYDISAPNKSTKIIEGDSSNVLNWDDARFPWAYPFYKNQLANFWIADEINMSGDVKQWARLTETERETFLKIIGLLAFLDSIQTDFSGKVADYLTDSSVSANMQVLSFFEVIHNQSYSYVLSSLVSKDKQGEVFEYWKHDDVLKERNAFIAEGYERFTANPTPQTFFEAVVFDVILEGLFFYSAFAFFYNLARFQKMLATCQMISYIQRDERLHVGIFSRIFKALLADFPELDTPENRKFVQDTFTRAAELEIKWAATIIGDKFEGVSMAELEEYIRFMANQRCAEMGMERPFPRTNRNSLPWIKVYEDVNSGKTDFFEGRPRTYGKVSGDNGFDDL